MSHPFRAAVEAGDHAAMVALLTEDVRFRSPVTFKAFEGRETVAHVLAAVLRIFDEFEYTDELEGDRVHVLVFRALEAVRDAMGRELGILPG